MKAKLQSVEQFTVFEIDEVLYYTRPIPNCPCYFASTLGDIISTKMNEPKVLAPADNGNGYHRVGVYQEGKRVLRRVHRLVASAFYEQPDTDPNGNERSQVNHMDSNKTNNKVSNLEWSSQSENQLHGYMMRGLNING